MRYRAPLLPLLLGATALFLAPPAPPAGAQILLAPPERTPEVPFVPTSPQVVDAMLTLAGVQPGDQLIDLGSGDGRIVIAAAQRGARGIGVDINPERIRESRENARAAGVEDRVEFRQGDLFEADLRGADVVTLYLLPSVNERLKPKLLAELAPGTRIVSHAFDMGDWEPVQTQQVGETTLYLWVVPERSGEASRAAP